MGVANAGNAEIDQASSGTDGASTPPGRWRPSTGSSSRFRGPAAEAVLRDAGPICRNFPSCRAANPAKAGLPAARAIPARTGFEIALPVDEADAFATALLADKPVQWIGLADPGQSLRLVSRICTDWPGYYSRILHPSMQA